MSAEAKKHLFMHMMIIVGTIIGTIIFGGARDYFLTMCGLIVGYWMAYYFWVRRKNVADTESKCTKHVVNGMLPLKYEKLPLKLQEELFKRHDHMDLPNGSDCIVYREKDVLELLRIIESGNYR